jgi:hypothetical protein
VESYQCFAGPQSTTAKSWHAQVIQSIDFEIYVED